MQILNFMELVDSKLQCRCR